MASDPDLRDDIRAVLRRLDELERKLVRAHSYLLLLLLVTACSLALNINWLMWLVLGGGAIFVLARIGWLYTRPIPPRKDEGSS